MKVTYNGKVIGEIIPEANLFRKKVKESKHLMVVYDGWALDKKLFDELIKPKGYDIQITDTENKKVYESTAENFALNAREIYYGGYGKQYCMARNKWEISDGKPRQTKIT